MSSSTTVSSAAASGTAVCTSNLYDIPVTDVACAMPYGKNHTDIMTKCCGDADVVSYYNDCGLYCLALGQSAGDLTECMYDNGAAHGVEVFCNIEEKNFTQSATGSGQADIPKTASASVIATAGSTSTSSKDDDDKDSKSSSGSKDSDSKETSSASKDEDDDSAAPSSAPSRNTLGLALGALLFSATAFGAFQI